MTGVLLEARVEAVRAIERAPGLLVPWAFEFTPASSEPVDQGYLRKVREADFVVWLVGEATSEKVDSEIREALASYRRLIVVKLPAPARDTATVELLEAVGCVCKWIQVDTLEQLRERLELSIRDEIVRAVRAKPGIGRPALLEELARYSRARCIERLQATGLPFSLASRFADNHLIGSPSAGLRTSRERPLLVLVGEIGSGKSLVLERLFQESIERYRNETNAPIPTWLAASTIQSTLEEAITTEARGLGDPSIQGAAVEIDGADEVGAEGTIRLLSEARVLVRAWPNTTIAIASRPLGVLNRLEEATFFQEMPEDNAWRLVGTAADREITKALSASWPQSLKKAIRRPLFALLAGSFLRDQALGVPRSVGELVSVLVNRSLQRLPPTSKDLLERLAVLSIERGQTPVPMADLGSLEEIGRLGNSGLVVERSDALMFSLPILTEWFAAHAIASGHPSPEEILQQSSSDRWRYVLAIFAATFGHDIVSRVLTPLATGNPALASRVVRDGLATWGLDEGILPPPAEECGFQVRRSMQAWVEGLGSLATLIAPVWPDGRLRPLGTRTSGAFLTTCWFWGEEPLRDIVEIEAGPMPFGTSPTPRHRIRSARPGRQSAWAWRWALEDLVVEVCDLLHSRAIPVDEGPLFVETMWQVALAVSGRGPLEGEPIDLIELQEKLDLIPRGATVIGRDRYWSWSRVASLRIHTEDLLASGQKHLNPPWPGPDLEFPLYGSTLWGFYSPDRIVARARAVYMAALQSYQALVEKWFPRFGNRLATFVMLPVHLNGIVSVPSAHESWATLTPAGMDWFIEPLPPGTSNVVEIRLGSEEESRSLVDSHFASVPQLLRQLRPFAVDWLHASAHSEYLDIFGPTPVTETTYKWLWEDLEETGWVEGLFRKT